jgi:ABC-type uncharacterized transport system substrate-binding protein
LREKNVVFEVRSAEEKVDRFPALVDELVRLKVDVILATSFGEILAAKNATKTIPIVFMTSGDPVAAGVIDSLAHPGGNLTGFTEIASVLAGKRLELLKETIPKLSRVALMWNPARGTRLCPAMERKPTGGTRVGIAPSFPWRYAAPINMRTRSKRQLRRVVPLSP